ncbi:Cystinosin-like protein [Diplonema papillatum]|nr:Cystinosin-like protein [Diplonema papillatum]
MPPYDDEEPEDGEPVNSGAARKMTRAAAPHGVIQIGEYEISKRTAIIAGANFIFVFGFAMGIGLQDTHSDDPSPWGRISAVIGWTYFAAWSISFYPQLYLNWVRKSVVGMSFDFQFLNLLGFACYSAFNVALYFVDPIKEDYQKMHNSSSPVRTNDVFFALHAELLTALTFCQIFMYERGDQRFHILPLLGTVVFMIVFALWFIDLVVKGGRYDDRPRPWIWIDFLNGLSWVKLGISVVKYTPQVYLNYRRKRTTGWNIWNVLLDFTGGSLSVAQLFMDCISQNDWSGVSGDPVKFGLGLCSMVFDTIFMYQHYFLYPANNALDVARDEAGLPTKDDPAYCSDSTDEEGDAFIQETGKQPNYNTASYSKK